MPRFVIEVSQPAGALARRRIDDAVGKAGSHFVTHADWRQHADVCSGTMIVEANNTSEVAGIVPPSMRPYTHIFRLELAVAA
jgi:hypothetical protein